MSAHFSLSISPIRAPVSFSSCKSVEVFVVPDAIRESTSFSVGMKGIFDCIVYFGFVHVFPINRKYPV